MSDTDNKGSVSVRTFQILREEIKHAVDEFEDEHADLWEKPDCHYCGRAMEVGALGGGEIKFGCYRDDCDIKEQESRWATYTTTRPMGPANEALHRKDAIVDLAHRLALEDRSLHTEIDQVEGYNER